jgi:septum formation protein
MKRLHLASSSPRRAELLKSLGLQFSQGAAGIDETRRAGERPAELVQRLSVEKARAVARNGMLVIGSDTEVVLDDEPFGKPASCADAIRMLDRLSGRTHQVMTGVAVLDGDSVHTALCVTDVSFRSIAESEARAYWESGEPRDKAGGYGIQGLGGLFVEEIRGSYSGVMGLPIFETAELLGRCGVRVIGGYGHE